MAIESSAHTLGVGIVKNGKVLANSSAMYKILDKGIIPAKVAEYHSKNVGLVIKRALKEAGISPNGIEAIGYTKGPGLGPCLRIAQVAARTIALLQSIPIFPVNHAVAHIEIAKRLSKIKNPLALYVSGGNSQIIGLVEEPFRHYHIYGETFDVGVGNMLDSFARAARLKPAWGSSVAKLAERGHYIPMPYTVKGMDFTFTGLQTNAIKMLEEFDHRDVAFSLQETAFAMLAEATERALLLTKSTGLILCGGVAQSAKLRKMLSTMAGLHKAGFYVAPNEYNTDNGAMIALVTELMLKNQQPTPPKRCTIDQKYRVDKVEITW